MSMLRSLPAWPCLTRSARIVVLAGALVLAGCAARPEKPAPKAAETQPPVNLSGYSPAFKQGFQDGCSTARGKPRRDEKRFGSEPQYARGWEDGRAICSRR